MVSQDCDDGVPGASRVCSWHPTATDALREAKERAFSGYDTHVNRVRVRVGSKKSVCRLLQGRIEYDTWDTLFLCHFVEGSVLTRRFPLQ